MLKLGALLMAFCFSTGSAFAQDGVPPKKVNYYVIMETGGAPHTVKMPMDQASDSDVSLGQAQMAVLGALAMLDKGDGNNGAVKEITFVETYAGLTSVTTPRELYHSDPKTYLEKFQSHKGLCAPLSVPFQTVRRRMASDQADEVVLVILSPLIDLRMEYCAGEKADPDVMFREGPSPDYRFDSILRDETLSGLVIIGASIDKEYSWNAYIEEHAHPSLSLEWMTLGEAAQRFHTKLRSF